MLLETITSCFLDKIARKIEKKDENNRKKIYYESIEVPQLLNLDEYSSVYKVKPDYICYTQITQQSFTKIKKEVKKRNYLKKMQNL